MTSQEFLGEKGAVKMRAQIQLLPDGRRLHLHDGPIDIVLEAFGNRSEVTTAYRAAADRFVTVLDELCTELPILRAQVSGNSPRPQGVIACRMLDAVVPFAQDFFITPMAAVAGAVAEEILLAMTTAADLERAYVNDGGDIALHLAPNRCFAIGMVETPHQPTLFGTLILNHEQPCRGLATSGWRGRSFSFGMADAVTVIARTASMADAAATIVANAVDLPGHPAVQRQSACEIAPDNDLGNRLVTTAVADLTRAEVDTALSYGLACARSLQVSGLVDAVALTLKGVISILSPTAENESPHQYENRCLIHA